jgi:DHA1 family multidrug resistance protein-like MFS transporter
MSWGSVIPALPAYTEQFGIGAIGLGVVIAAFGLGRLIVNIPAGLLARRVSPWPFLVALVFGVFACTIATGFMTEFVPVLVLRFVTGIFSGAAITIGQTMVLAGAPPEARGRVSSILQSVQLAGAALGPALGGIAVSLWNVQSAFLAASSGCAVFLVWALVRWRRVRPARIAPASGDGSPTSRSSIAGRASRRMTIVAVAAVNGVGFVIFSVRFGGQQGLVPLLGVELVDLQPWQLGFGLGAITVVALCFTHLIGVAADRWDHRVVLAPLLLASAALTPLYLVVEEPVGFLVVLVAVGVTGSIISGIPLASLAETVAPSRLSLAMGVYRTFGDLGTILGPIAFTAILAAGGPTPAVLALAGLSLGGALLACVRTRRPEGSSVDLLDESDLVGPEVPRADLERTPVG